MKNWSESVMEQSVMKEMRNPGPKAPGIKA